MIYYLIFLFTSPLFVIVNPYLQVVLSNLGYGFKAVGIFQAFFEGFGILGPLLVGYIANKKGWYKGLLVFSLVVCGISFYTFSFINSIFLVVLLLILMGFFFRTLEPLLDSIVNIAIKGESSKYTKIRSFGTIGFVLVSSFLSLIKQPDVTSNKSITSWFAFFAAIAIIVVVFLPKAEKKEIPKVKIKNKKIDIWHTKGLMIGLVLIGLSRFAMASVVSFLSLYSIEVINYTNLTTLNLVAAASEFFAMLYSGYLLQNKKVKPIHLLILGSLAVSIRLFLYAFLPSVTFLFLGQTLHSLAFGSFHVSAIMFVNQHVKIEKRDIGISLYFALGISLPTVLGSSIGGVVVSTFGFKTLFIVYGLISLIAVLMGFVFYKPLSTNIEQSGI